MCILFYLFNQKSSIADQSKKIAECLQTLIVSFYVKWISLWSNCDVLSGSNVRRSNVARQGKTIDSQQNAAHSFVRSKKSNFWPQRPRNLERRLSVERRLFIPLEEQTPLLRRAVFHEQYSMPDKWSLKQQVSAAIERWGGKKIAFHNCDTVHCVYSYGSLFGQSWRHDVSALARTCPTS